MNNWEKENTKKTNGNYENIINKYFTGEPSGERFDKIAEILLKQSHRGGNGGNLGSVLFGQEFIVKMIAVIGGTLIAAFIGFTWLEGKFETMMEKASPYAKEKAIIEIKQELQDGQIKDLYNRDTEQDVKIGKIQEYLNEEAIRDSKKK